jgi:transcriptional regulator
MSRGARRGGAAEMIASQIPFLVERRANGMLLQGHIARPNPQAADLDDGAEVLAIFPGPHAYISPSWYEAGPAVPTWNYASVHAYGTARAIRDPEWLRDMLERLSARHEAREAAPWRMRDLPQAYLEAMLRGIIGIEIEISRLEGKFKLSQNRPASDRPRIITALERRGDQTSREVAGLMRARLMREPEPAAE